MKIVNFVLLGLCSILAACGSTPMGNGCETTMSRLCDVACDCTTPPKCSLTLADGFIHVNFEGHSACVNFHVAAVCEGTEAVPLSAFTECNTALDSAECASDSDDGLVLPEECRLTDLE